MDTNSLIQRTKIINKFEGKDPTIVMENPTNLAERDFEISVSRSGIPCMFEAGGAYKHKGWSMIITSKSGNAKRPIMIKNRGPLACQYHALIPITNNTLIFEGRQDNNILSDGSVETVVRVYKVASIDIENKIAHIEPITYEGKRHPVICAALKANHYHCRTPYYIRRDRLTEDVTQKISKPTERNEKDEVKE